MSMDEAQPSTVLDKHKTEPGVSEGIHERCVEEEPDEVDTVSITQPESPVSSVPSPTPTPPHLPPALQTPSYNRRQPTASPRWPVTRRWTMKRVRRNRRRTPYERDMAERRLDSEEARNKLIYDRQTNWLRQETASLLVINNLGWDFLNALTQQRPGARFY